MHIEAGARTDLGRVRKNNEDCYSIDSSLQLYVLSDGMGGEAHGEVASHLAVQTVVSHCRQGENSRSTPLFGESSPEVSERTNRLASAIHLANRKVYETAGCESRTKGHGSDDCGRLDRRAKAFHCARRRQPGLFAASRVDGSADGRSFAGSRKSARGNSDAAGSRCQRNAKCA